MPEDHLKNKELKLLLKIPVKILAEQELTLNEKYILGLDYALLEKLGYNNYTNKAVQDILHIHRNLISRARIQLIKKGFLSKEKRVYRLTPLALYYCDQDDPMVYIPQWVYTMDNLTTGGKLLYAEYNAMC